MRPALYLAIKINLLRSGELAVMVLKATVVLLHCSASFVAQLHRLLVAAVAFGADGRGIGLGDPGSEDAASFVGGRHIGQRLDLEEERHHLHMLHHHSSSWSSLHTTALSVVAADWAVALALVAVVVAVAFVVQTPMGAEARSVGAAAAVSYYCQTLLSIINYKSIDLAL